MFYEDTEEMVRKAVSDPAGYATRFGYSGTNWDYVQEIACERGGVEGLVDLDIAENEVRAILTKAGFTGYRFDGAAQWIMKTLDMIKAL